MRIWLQTDYKGITLRITNCSDASTKGLHVDAMDLGAKLYQGSRAQVILQRTTGGKEGFVVLDSWPLQATIRKAFVWTGAHN